MKCSRRTFLAVWLLASGTGITRAEDAAQLLAAGFEPVVRDMMTEYAIPGVSVAVVKDGEPVYAQAFGVKNVETGEPVTVRSLFHMASVTKTFVATAVMQLWEQGKVDLDAPLVQYLPYFKMRDLRYKEITVAQMLNHTSGMPDVMNYEWNRPAYDDSALEEYIRSLFNRELIAAPGTRERYSNMAFDVLGGLIATVSGMTFEDYVEQHILKPLGMKDSTLMKPEADPALLTAPHVRKANSVEVSKVFPYNRKHAPSSTLLSNALDMSRWGLANLHRGELDGIRILKDATYDVLWRPKDNAFPNRGMSWFLGEHRGWKTVAHGGSDLGYTCYLVLLPEKQAGVIVAANLNGAPASKLAFAAVDILLDNEPGAAPSNPHH